MINLSKFSIVSEEVRSEYCVQYSNEIADEMESLQVKLRRLEGRSECVYKYHLMGIDIRIHSF